MIHINNEEQIFEDRIFEDRGNYSLLKAMILSSPKIQRPPIAIFPIVSNELLDLSLLKDLDNETTV